MNHSLYSNQKYATLIDIIPTAYNKETFFVFRTYCKHLRLETLGKPVTTLENNVEKTRFLAENEILFGCNTTFGGYGLIVEYEIS